MEREKEEEEEEEVETKLPFFLPLSFYNDTKLQNILQLVGENFTIKNSGDKVTDSYGAIKGYLYTTNGTRKQ